MNAAALIVAGGSGRRFGAATPKQYLTLAGQSILQRTIDVFLSNPKITLVQVVINPDASTLYDQATVKHERLLPPTAGGAERQDSVRAGLEALVPHQPDFVLIHDAARPFLDPYLIDRTLEAAQQGGAIAAVRMTDTVKRAAVANDIVAETLDRALLWRAQTPQTFRFKEILAAHRAAVGLALPDDAAVAERAGVPIHLIESTDGNMKITTADDLVRAEQRLTATAAPLYPRVGNGFDVHRFGPGDHVTLCGLKIPHTAGLLGHSDADVGLHALTDAILGAISAGDIGQHFPPSEPRWRGADSGVFLAHARDLVKERGGRLLHVDVTVICERPKVGPHRAAMVARIAELLKLSPDRVSVKATTTEQLGFTGRGEGIAAQATATILMP
jgi:2-C-methyl-D-erythritol 4-phosphate cytidylyltransferase/2-C-methyl-D-erythritol 2,4-cyclodiphosphate synthase